jgi:cbb3-type cytochrome oxidase subunit 3
MAHDFGLFLLGICFGCLIGSAYAYWDVRRRLRLIMAVIVDNR